MKIQVQEVKLGAGLYKPNTIMVQHGLILAAIAGSPASLSYQLHGKRQRRTAIFSATLRGLHIGPFLDKFIHEILPIIPEFKTPKWKKAVKSLAKSYTLRLRYKMQDFDDFVDLLEPVMYDSHRGMFLPLAVHFNWSRPSSYTIGEAYFRMLRLPISMFTRRFRPAFDDSVSF